MNSNVSQVFPFPAQKSTNSSNASVRFVETFFLISFKVNKDMSMSPFAEFDENNKIGSDSNQANSAGCKDFSY